MKTILVPTDFSATAKNAEDIAVSIAKKTGSEIVLLHVVEEVEEGSFNVEGEVSSSGSWEDRIFTARMIKKSREQLDAAAARLSATGVPVKALLRVGTPYHGIQAIITDRKSDLVVMGTNGRAPLEEILIGSNTEKVIRRSSCPVLSVNQAPTKFDLKSIVYAVSLRNDEMMFPPILKELQAVYGSTIHLVRVNTPSLFLNDKVAKEKLAKFAEMMKLKNFTLNIYNDFSEESGIINFADTVNADIIAMATHGRTGLSHLVNGSIAEDVKSHSRRAVLTALFK